MNTAGRLLASVCGLVLIVGLPPAILANSWSVFFFDPERISQTVNARLIESGVLQDLVIESMLAREGDQAGQPRSFDFLDDAGRRRLVELLIPAGWEAEQLRQLVHSFFEWIDSDQPLPQFSLDVAPLQERMLAGGAQELMAMLIASWPECTADQIEQMRVEGFGGEMFPSLLCQPPESMRAAMIEEGAALVNRQLRDLPPRLPLGEQIGAEQPEQASDLKANLRRLRAVTAWSWLLPLSSLGIITALAVRSFAQLLRWWGAPLLASGLAAFIGAAALRPALERLAQQALQGTQLPAILRDTLLAIGGGLLDDIVGRGALIGLLLAVIGAGMLGAGLYLRRRPASQVPAAQSSSPAR